MKIIKGQCVRNKSARKIVIDVELLLDGIFSDPVRFFIYFVRKNNKRPVHSSSELSSPLNLPFWRVFILFSKTTLAKKTQKQQKRKFVLCLILFLNISYSCITFTFNLFSNYLKSPWKGELSHPYEIVALDVEGTKYKT